VGDLIIALGYRGGDPAFSQPCPVCLRGVPFVSEYPVGPGAWSAFAGARDARMSSSVAVIIVVSFTFPPVIIMPNGLPRPSATRCSFVVKPPRERPIA
jgi:hypothetical protein